jgi:hypothetical protein
MSLNCLLDAEYLSLAMKLFLASEVPDSLFPHKFATALPRIQI